MAVLVYKVTVRTDNPEGDVLYLSKVRDTFRMITEELAPFGYTDDESFSVSDVSREAGD